MPYTTGALEDKAQAEYDARRDQVVEVRRVSGYDASDNSVDQALEPPVAMRVLPLGSEDQLRRWMDGGWLDPTWDVEPLNPDEPQLQGLRSFWVYATSYNTDGRTAPGEVVEA